jgi:hypothetical protein
MRAATIAEASRRWVRHCGGLDHAAGPKMSEEHSFPVRLTPTERIALEWIKAGKEPTAAALEAVIRRGWARHAKGKTEITPAGEKALAEGNDARRAARSAQRPRRR